MKVAILGGGSLGMQYAQNLCKLGGVELTGVCDIQAEAANKLADECQTVAYTSFDEMITRAEPDIVCVCLPTHVQKEYVLKAVEQGKHVICEAPMAATAAEAEEMIAAAEAKGVSLFVGFAGQFSPYYKNMKDKIAKGSIGDAGVVHIQHSGPRPAGCDDWYSDENKSEGLILQRLIHDIFLTRWLLGEVRTVYAMRRTVSGVDYALVTLRLANDAIVNLAGHWGDPDPYRCRVEIAGNKGVIRYDSKNAGSFEMKTKRGSASTESAMLHSSYYYQLEHFLDCLRTGKAPQITVHDVRQAHQIAEGAIRSAKTGMPVSWGGMNRG